MSEGMPGWSVWCYERVVSASAESVALDYQTWLDVRHRQRKVQNV